MQNLYQLGMRYAQLPAADRRHMSNDQGTDGKVVADQIGHTLDVNRNVYTRLAFDRHAEAVNKAGFTVSGELMSILEVAVLVGWQIIESMERGKGFRTHVNRLGRLTPNH